MVAGPAALSGFASRSWLASIQADSLRSRHLPRSAKCKMHGRRFSQLPGIEVGVPRPPGSSLRRLVVGREELHHQGGELTPLRLCQRFQDLLLDTVDDGVEFEELVDSGRGDGDDVTAPVRGVDGPLDESA